MMLPIVEHMRVSSQKPELEELAERMAARLLAEQPELAMPPEFQKLRPERLGEGPALHLDDLSEITRVIPGEDQRFYQDRARLRAGDGDLIATCANEVEGAEDYFRDRLGLGRVEWLRPRLPHNPLRIAEACWEDEAIRQKLIAKVASGDLGALHPHMGTLAAWELAVLLTEETGRPLQVIAPPPGLASWVNHKVAFAKTVCRLFGAGSIPLTESAWNLSQLACRVQELAKKANAIVLKLPDSSGGVGNVQLKCKTLAGASLIEIEQIVQKQTGLLAWKGDCELQVDVWEENVLSSPSVQVWIPPEAEGPPVIEGLFTQLTQGDEGTFVGTIPADLPDPPAQLMVDRSWTLARLYQRLGYVGRCSFDWILVGEEFKTCRAELIECNGRWGGTSLPMLLMNRLFGDWKTQPFAVEVFHHLHGLEKVPFAEILEKFEDDLFDARTGRGTLIFFNVGRLQFQSGISVIFLGKTIEEASGPVRRRFTERLLTLAREADDRK